MWRAESFSNLRTTKMGSTEVWASKASLPPPASPLSHLLSSASENAMKAAGHELRGLNAYLSLGLERGILFPIFCVIDYLGCRLAAASQIPISSDTLVYGSNNVGTQGELRVRHFFTF